MKKRISLLFIFILFWMFFLSPTNLEAAQFDFYYQTVTGITDLNTASQEGDSLWTSAKKLVKKGVNTVKGLWEQNVTRISQLDEGDFKWYSKEDKNVAYDVSRVKVESEEHLLTLMGVDNEKELSDGQKALLEIYRSSKEEAIAERAQYDFNKRIGVVLTDSTGVDLEYTTANGEKKTIDNHSYSRDFWSWSQGSTIHMATHNYTGASAPENARSTFLHEYCHSIDRTIMEIFRPYGKDGAHYASEKSKKRAAFVEGWAEYNEMLESEKQANYMRNSMDPIMIELSDKEGKIALEDPDRRTYQAPKSVYEYVSPESLTGMDLLDCEAYNANIMYRIATEISDGRNKIYDAFVGTRLLIIRDLKTVLKKLCKDNPEDVAVIGRIVDELTLGKLSDKEMTKVLGNTAAVKEFLKEREAGYPSDDLEMEELIEDQEKEVQRKDSGSGVRTSPALKGTLFDVN